MTEIDEHQSEAEAFQELIATLDPEAFTLFAEADIGREAKEFISSAIGRYLLGCAQQEYKEAVFKLKRTAFWRFRRIQQLQNDIWRAETFMLWIRDLIVRGRAAEIGLAEREET
jgi:hypothetical protein